MVASDCFTPAPTENLNTSGLGAEAVGGHLVAGAGRDARQNAHFGEQVDVVPGEIVAWLGLPGHRQRASGQEDMLMHEVVYRAHS